MNIKHFFQRAIRGYDDTLFWGMDEYLAPIILAGLKNLKENQSGHPACYTEEEWDYKLDKMIEAFQLIEDIGTTKELLDAENNKVVKEGLALFAENYFSLWT